MYAYIFFHLHTLHQIFGIQAVRVYHMSMYIHLYIYQIREHIFVHAVYPVQKQYVYTVYIYIYIYVSIDIHTAWSTLGTPRTG